MKDIDAHDGAVVISNMKSSLIAVAALRYKEPGGNAGFTFSAL